MSANDIKPGFGSPRFWWSAVVIYIALLPWAVAIWLELLARLGKAQADLAPLLLLALLALAIALRAVRRRAGPGQWMLLAAAAALSAGLFVLTPIPAKRIHIAEYIVLALLINQAFSAGGGLRGQRIWVVAVCIVLGVVDETLQGLIPSRFFGYQDILTNTGGALAGAMVLGGLNATPNKAAGPPFRPVPVGLALGQVALTLWLLTDVQRRLWNGTDGIAGWPMTQGAALLLWVGISTLWLRRMKTRAGETGVRAVFFAATAILLLLSIGRLGQIQFQ